MPVHECSHETNELGGLLEVHEMPAVLDDDSLGVGDAELDRPGVGVDVGDVGIADED